MAGKSSARRLCFISMEMYPMLRPGIVPMAGGSGQQLLQIARGMKARGHAVSLVVGDYGQPAREEIDGLTVLSAHRQGQRGSLTRGLGNMFRLYRAMAAARAEVFVLRSTRLLAGPCHLFARRFGGRFIFMIANASNCDPMAREGAPPPFNRWYRRAIRGADAVAAQTRDQQRQMRERFGIETYLVPNGIDLDGLAPSGDPPEWDVLWVGSLKPQKQPDVLIRIAAFCPQLRFGVIGGPGGDRLYYEEAVAALQQQPNCEYLGFIPPDRIGRYYHRARILLNTSIGRGRVSLHEGFPNTYLFAWAQGVPTCSLHVDPDGVIAEQGLGFVESDVESLSARLVSFVTDEDGYEAARRRCRAHVAEHHSLQATLDAFAGLLGVLP